MSATLLAVVVDCTNAQSQATWWAGVLGHQVSERNRLHIDITTDTSLEDGVARLVAAGAQLVEVRQDPAAFENADRWAVMQDPEGNEFCVLNAGSVTGL